MKRVLRGRHTVLSNHHFRIRIVYSLNHPFSGFSGFKIEGYCTVYKIKRHSAPLIVRDCLSIRNAVSVNSFEPGTPGTLITTNVRACVCVPTHAQSCQSPCDPIDCSPAGSSARDLQQEYWDGLPFPPPGVQASNPHLLCLLHLQMDS